MGNVIDFLERVGRDASLRYGDGFDEALRDEALDDPEREALTGADGDALRRVLKLGISRSTQMGDPQKEEVPSEDDDDATPGGDPSPPGGLPPESPQ